MQGNLTEISVADLVQLNCQDAKTAMLQINRDTQQIKLYFKNGRVVHAFLGELVGEEAVYRALNWSEGSFELLMDEESELESIQRSWPSLLLEAAHQADENQAAKKSSASKVAKLAADQQSLESLLLGAASQIAGLDAAVLFQADGREMANYSPSAAGRDEYLTEELTTYAEGVKAKLGQADILKITDQVISSDKGSLLICFLDKGSKYLAVKVTHSPKDRPAIAEKLHSLSKMLAVQIEEQLKLPVRSNSASDPLVFVDADGNVAFANRKLLSLTGEKKLSEVVEKPLHQLLAAEPEPLDHLVADLAKKGVVHSRVFEIKQGAEFVSCSGVATFDEKGDFLQADIFLYFLSAPQDEDSKTDSQSENPELASYLSAQLEGLHTFLKDSAGANFSNRMSMSINETAERSGWPVQISDGKVDVGAKMEIEACAALMAKAIIICNKAVGQKKTRTQIETLSTKYGERAQPLSAALGATGLLTPP